MVNVTLRYIPRRSISFCGKCDLPIYSVGVRLDSDGIPMDSNGLRCTPMAFHCVLRVPRYSDGIQCDFDESRIGILALPPPSYGAGWRTGAMPRNVWGAHCLRVGAGLTGHILC